MHRSPRWFLAGAMAVLVGCTDEMQPFGVVPVIPQAAPAVASLRGTVDLVAGTLTFAPVTPSAGSLGGSAAISPAIYGNQGITVRIYNSPVVTSDAPAPGRKRFTAQVGVRNLQAFPIGDEQGGPVPTDTAGIFVFVNGGPTVTRTSSECPSACGITVANAHGRLAFNAPNQPYWYWKDRLSEAGGLRDTTLIRQSWSFEADTQVTGFTFDVLVAAAWPAPHQTRWSTQFPGDVLPHLGLGQRWERETSLGTETTVLDPAAAGSILLTALPGGSQTFTRRDSIAPSTEVYMEARLKLNASTAKPEVSFGFYDGARFIAVALSGARAGFVDNGFTSPSTSVAMATTTFQTYRIRKFGADSVQLLVNGSRVLSRPYAAFTITYPTTLSFFEFGNPGRHNQQQSQSGNSSTWDYVIYEIGATQP